MDISSLQSTTTCTHISILSSAHSAHFDVDYRVISDQSPLLAELSNTSPVVHLPNSSVDLAPFLDALSHGIPKHLSSKLDHFPTASAILRLSTQYQASSLRAAVIRHFQLRWPATLQGWDLRNKSDKKISAVRLPHPILIINLARETNATELLPSAFYDLSRALPSEIVQNHTENGCTQILSLEDIHRALLGRECASRFFSTFIVEHLEYWSPSSNCSNTEDTTRPVSTCALAFRTIAQEIMRDINGFICGRLSDPLYALLESDCMQSDTSGPGAVLSEDTLACEFCRAEYSTTVLVARQQFWSRIPSWFSLDNKA